MPVLDRATLVESPLADLHALASELTIDGYRRLRRADLISAILDRQNGGEGPDESDADAEGGGASRRRRSRSGRGRGRGAAGEADTADTADAADAADATDTIDTADASDASDPAVAADTAADDDGDEEAAPKPRRGRSRAAESDATDEERPARTRRRRGSREPAEPTAETTGTPTGAGEAEETVEGVVELLGNGSGFVRVAGPDPSDDDVYISAAQVKRCELVSGDAITGPKRAPRRSERFASLVRIETINGRPAAELAEGVRFEDLPAAFPAERLRIGSEDPTLKAIEWLTPFGLGSRVTIVGAARAGKSEALRRLGAALAEHDELTLTVALAGVRPEEIAEWGTGALAPAAAASLAHAEEAQLAALEPVVDQARRLAARGAHAVVLIDSLDGLSPQAARRLMASARNIVDGGSVTLIATASAPVGGETTVIALDVTLASVGRFPALDLLVSGTLRPELLVGEAGAEAIARTRAEVIEEDED